MACWHLLTIYLPPGLSVKASCGTASHCCHVAVQWLFSKFRFHHSKSPACISAPQGMMWACKKTQPTWQDALRQLDPSCLSYILKRSAERIRRPRRKCNSFRQPKMFCTTKYRTEQVYSWVENWFLQCSSAVLPHAYIHIHIYIYTYFSFQLMMFEHVWTTRVWIRILSVWHEAGLPVKSTKTACGFCNLAASFTF